MIQLSDLIEAQRCELQQYGEMLARFDDAEAYRMQDTAEETLSKAATFHEQEATIDRTVRRRGKSNAGSLDTWVCMKMWACWKSFP